VTPSYFHTIGRLTKKKLTSKIQKINELKQFLEENELVTIIQSRQTIRIKTQSGASQTTKYVGLLHYEKTQAPSAFPTFE